jgi:hypothetical protein
MANTNWLINMRCPRCGSEGPFWIDCNAVALIGDDGPIKIDAPDWSCNNWTTCKACDYSADARAFGNRNLVNTPDLR